MIAVWATPGARQSQIMGVAAGHLRIRLRAPAVEDRANEELLRFLAAELGVPVASLRLTAGRHSRRKRVHVKGLTLAQVAASLGLS